MFLSDVLEGILSFIRSELLTIILRADNNDKPYFVFLSDLPFFLIYRKKEKKNPIIHILSWDKS